MDPMEKHTLSFRAISVGKPRRLPHHIRFCPAFLFPFLLMGQTAQLTEQLGRTVLYEDLALSPDGKGLAWAQTTVATSSKAAHIASTTGDSRAKVVDIGTSGERFDTDFAWSPDSKTLAFFSASGETAQAQLWAVNSDGSNPRKCTELKGHVGRPRWSRDGTGQPCSLHSRAMTICS
jgi:dipeptidyl aminopeptidase/acylaminoacyl peptidase